MNIDKDWGTGKGFVVFPHLLNSVFFLLFFLTSLHQFFKIPSSSLLSPPPLLLILVLLFVILLSVNTVIITIVNENLIQLKCFFSSYSPVVHSKVWRCPFLGQCSTLAVVFAD